MPLQETEARGENQPSTTPTMKPFMTYKQAISLLKACSSSFSIGCSVKTLLNIIGSLLSNRRKTHSSLINLVIDNMDIKFGLFLMWLSAGFKASLHCLKKIEALRDAENPKDTSKAWSIAGAISGMSLFLIPRTNWSTFSVYTLTNTAESLTTSVIYPRIPEEHRWMFVHFDVFLMSLAAFQILYCYVGKPYTLSQTYLKFLKKFGGKDQQVLDLIGDQFYHRPLDIPKYTEYFRSKSINPEPILSPYVKCGQLVDFCKVIHPNQGCVSHFLTFAFSRLYPSLVMYLPLHTTLQTILYVMKLSNAKKYISPIEPIYKIVRYTVMSSMFLIFYCTLAWLGACMCSRAGIRGGFWSRKVFKLWCFIAPGLATFFEEKSRRMELALYCIPRAMESAYNDVHSMKLIPFMPSLENASPFIFSFSLAILAYLYKKNPENIKYRYRRIVGWIWDKKETDKEKKKMNLARASSHKEEKIE